MELVSEAPTRASLQGALGSALSQNHSVCDNKEAHMKSRVIRHYEVGNTAKKTCTKSLQPCVLERGLQRS